MNFCYLEELEDFLPASEEEYVHNSQSRRASEKTIELAIEAVISIVSMIVSQNKYGLPQSEDDLIAILKEKKILSKDVAAIIQQMKGFRNVLVHRYDQVNDHLAYETMSENIGDFAKFEKEIRKYLQGLK